MFVYCQRKDVEVMKVNKNVIEMRMMTVLMETMNDQQK